MTKHVDINVGQDAAERYVVTVLGIDLQVIERKVL